MKFLMFLFLLVTLHVFGQKEPKIERLVINDQIIHGTIDEKYPITIYLHFHAYSPDNYSFYSVDGWYYYDNMKKKIPLVGIYSGDLVLYQFENKSSCDSVLKLEGSGDNYMEHFDKLLEKTNYKERFQVSYEDYQYKGKWDNHKKSLPLTFHTSEIDVDVLKEYLKVAFGADKTYSYDLAQIGEAYYDYSIYAWKYVEGKYRLILHYETASSANPNGMCGAGVEAAYVYLEINKEGQILEFKEEVVESCHRNIYNEKQENSNADELVLKVYKGDDSERILYINKTLVSVQSKK